MDALIMLRMPFSGSKVICKEEWDKILGSTEKIY